MLALSYRLSYARGMEQTLAGGRRGIAKLSPESKENPFRAKRIADLVAICGERPMTRIIDLGGSPAFWRLWRHAFDWRRLEVTCVNLDPSDVTMRQVRHIQADATDLHWIRDKAFDLAFSNSVIEHVGRDRMLAFAREATRIARRVYIQTPDYWFPVEAHTRFPGFQWMPKRFKIKLLRNFQLGFCDRASTDDEAERIISGTDLLTARELAALFPSAKVRRERFLGFSKALIAEGGDCHLPTHPVLPVPDSLTKIDVPAPPGRILDAGSRCRSDIGFGRSIAMPSRIPMPFLLGGESAVV